MKFTKKQIAMLYCIEKSLSYYWTQVLSLEMCVGKSAIEIEALVRQQKGLEASFFPSMGPNHLDSSGYVETMQQRGALGEDGLLKWWVGPEGDLELGLFKKVKSTQFLQKLWLLDQECAKQVLQQGVYPVLRIVLGPAVCHLEQPEQSWPEEVKAEMPRVCPMDVWEIYRIIEGLKTLYPQDDVYAHDSAMAD